MTGSRVVLVSVAGPRGHVDVGVRADATVSQLAAALGEVIGLGTGDQLTAVHKWPPRPDVPGGCRAVPPGISLAASGVADGDLITLAPATAPAGGAPAGTTPATTGTTVTGETADD